VLGARRHFLVDKRSQLRACFMATSVTLVLLVLLNLSLHSARSQGTAAVLAKSPELEALLAEHNRWEFQLGLAASFVFLAAVFGVTMLETHRTAGAALNLTRQLHRIGAGRLAVRRVLRKGANLRDVEQAFNGMAQALRDRTAEDTEALENLASTAAEIGTPLEARELADKLRGLAARLRERLS
jgi:hypothetical protein